MNFHGSTKADNSRLVTWKKPANGYVKLNTHEAVCQSTNRAATGGPIRDEQGNWLLGFLFNFGLCIVIATELWGNLKGLNMCWEKGWRWVELESDSLVSINMIKKSSITSSCYSNLIHAIKDILKREWIVEVNHIFKEGNQAADWLSLRPMRLQGFMFWFPSRMV